MLTKPAALQTVARAKLLRNEIYQLYAGLVGTAYPHSFIELIDQLPSLCSTFESDTIKNRQVRLLISKCGPLDTLLTKNFKSPKRFEALLRQSIG